MILKAGIPEASSYKTSDFPVAQFGSAHMSEEFQELQVSKQVHKHLIKFAGVSLAKSKS